MNKKKNNYFEMENLSKYRNVIMGLAIISIIIFHFTDDCSIYSYNYKGWIYYFNKYIGSSGVDIFLCLSGIGLYYSFKKNTNLKEFYKKRFIKVLIPYFILCLPALIWRYIIYENIGMVEVFKYFTFISFFQKGGIWFWYIFLISFCYLIFPYIFNVFDEEQSIYSEQMRMLIFFTFFVVMGMWLFDYNNSLFGNINIAFLRLPSFIFGCYLGKQAYYKRKIPKSQLLFFIIMSVCCLYLRMTNRLMVTRFVLAFFAMSLMLVIILLLDKFKHLKIVNKISNIFETIGKYTLELYLTHVTIRCVLCSYGFLTCRIRYELLLVLISVFLSIIIKKISRLIESKLLKQ